MKVLLARVGIIGWVLHHGIFAIIGDLVLCALHLCNRDKTVSKMQYHGQCIRYFWEIIGNQEMVDQCDELLWELEELK